MALCFYVKTSGARVAFRRLACALLLAAALASALGLLYCALCAFTWEHDRLSDYGIYLNMMWNTAHGHPFRYLMEASYLRVHLSFTVGLAGMFFRLWDHPFLPALLQWLCSVLGAALVGWTAWRRRLPGFLAAALTFFYLGYRLTQSVHAHEFHGVGLYFLLIPILYAVLCFRRSWAWLPALLILGVREESFLVILPMLLYFTVRDRWRGGWWLIAACALYGVLAVFVLYPAINGISLFAKRTAEISEAALKSFLAPDPIEARLRGVMFVLLPILALCPRYWRTALFFPSAAMLICLGSAWPSQYGMGTHYSAPVMACLVCGLLEASARRQRDECAESPPPWALAASALVLLTVLVHLHSGFLPGGGKSSRIFTTLNVGAWASLHAASHIPPDGILLTDDDYVAFCGNRADVRVCHLWKPGQAFDHVFLHIRKLAKVEHGWLLERIRSGELGVRYFDGMNLVLSRGYRTEANPDVLLRGQRQRMVYETARHGGRNVYYMGLPCRYWWGNGSRSPVNLSYGGSWHLEPGCYEAILAYRAQTPTRQVRRHWGWFSVHRLNAREDLSRIYIPEVAAQGAEWQSIALPFTVDIPEDVEFRITGADAPLWLHRVYWRPQPGTPDAGPHA